MYRVVFGYRQLVSNLVFSAVARDRWVALNRSDSTYERSVRDRVRAVLDRLDQTPQRHRVGATQFQTSPTTWGQLISPPAGADWLIIWTTVPDGKIYVLRIEPAPSL
ncbi:hypothetical protein CKW46_07115 [Mycobacterium liflandii]|nr:hypothetical protein CKW46_07115 [Mycobacterium liflandii]